MLRWLAISLSVLPVLLFIGAQRAERGALFLPGTTSDGHHAIEERCESCHTPFAGVSQQSCLRCHAAALSTWNDTHAPAKFEDPRWAGQLAVIDARLCVTCHREHRPEARLRGSVSVPADFCMGCHAEVTSDRPSHRTFDTTSCAATACHNYHDNRSLHVDFLRRHRHQAPVKGVARVPERSRGVAAHAVAASRGGSGTSGPWLLRPRTPRPPDAPAAFRLVPAVKEATEDWAASSHAAAGITCSGCHIGMARSSGGAESWQVPPATCGRCHDQEHAGFLSGKHGMRMGLVPSLSPMRPGLARLPMRPEAAQHPLGCATCHSAHAFEVGEAAAESCARCHDDPHTRAYPRSPHFALWLDERAGRASPGSGVSCATCHLPRRMVGAGGEARVEVVHDQSANLRPPDRMAREVCLHCHGYAFSLAALADPILAASNYRGQPAPLPTAMKLVEESAR